MGTIKKVITKWETVDAFQTEIKKIRKPLSIALSDPLFYFSVSQLNESYKTIGIETNLEWIITVY